MTGPEVGALVDLFLALGPFIGVVIVYRVIESL
jgi:hypothetical protein